MICNFKKEGYIAFDTRTNKALREIKSQYGVTYSLTYDVDKALFVKDKDDLCYKVKLYNRDHSNKCEFAIKKVDLCLVYGMTYELVH